MRNFLIRKGYLEDNFGIFGGYLGDVRGPLHSKSNISLSKEEYLEDNFGIFGGFLGDVRGICMDYGHLGLILRMHHVNS